MIMSESIQNEDMNPPSEPDEYIRSPSKQTDRLLASCGYLLVIFSVVCFGAVAYLKIYQVINQTPLQKYETFEGFIQGESATIVLILIGYITLSKGKGLMTEVRITDNRTIPLADLPLVQGNRMKRNGDRA
jgi:hypothetical protein